MANRPANLQHQMLCFAQLSQRCASLRHGCWMCTCSKPSAELWSIFEIIYGAQKRLLTCHFHKDLQVAWQLLLFLISHGCLKSAALNRQQNSAFLSTSKYDTSSTQHGVHYSFIKGTWVALKCKQALIHLYVLRRLSGLELFSVGELSDIINPSLRLGK